LQLNISRAKKTIYIETKFLVGDPAYWSSKTAILSLFNRLRSLQILDILYHILQNIKSTFEIIVNVLLTFVLKRQIG